ncbi:hypothetical protein QL285_028382 [Trifolium repens]|nr:hypothetical protein QL285_028382 [Trifolium repens]
MSSRVPPILQGSPKGWFVTMHLPDEAVGELDPCFVASFCEEFGVAWEIFDSTGTRHQLQFNCSPTKPLLTTGWEDLRPFYKWSGNVKLHFFYYGDNKFFMLINNKNIFAYSDFPTFHSLSTSIANCSTFFWHIKAADLCTPTVILSKSLDKFIKPSSHAVIKFSGPLDNVVTVRVSIDSKKFGRFMFGEGWNVFCQRNGIIEGNVLQLKIDKDIDYSNVVMVTVAY